MIEVFGAIVQNGHDIGIVVLIVVVERVKEHSETIPTVWRSEHFTIVVALIARKPNSLKRNTNVSLSTFICSSQMEAYKSISSNTSTAWYPEDNFDFPPVERGRFFCPNGTLLAFQRWRYSYTFRTCNGIYSQKKVFIYLKKKSWTIK